MTNLIIAVVCIVLIYLIFKVSSLIEKRIEKIEKNDNTGIVQGWRTDLNFLITLFAVWILAIRALIAGFAWLSSLI